MKLGLLIATMLLGSMSQASTQLLAECRGSVVKGNIGEIYRIELNNKNEIAVNGQYVDSFNISMPANSSTVKANTSDKLVVNFKKNIFTKKTLTIDFKTGQGTATQFIAIDSLLKTRTIYLSSCTR